MDLLKGESRQNTLLQLLSKGGRNWECCRTALGGGNGFSELHPSLSWLSHHLPRVPLQKELNIPGCRVCCDPSTR